MISRELLSEVLEEKVVSIGEGVYSESKICYTLSKMGLFVYRDINIHELAHKCKEWALEQGYILKSRIFDSNGGSSCQICKPVKDVEYIEAETETEAIFKACQYILDNKN